MSEKRVVVFRSRLREEHVSEYGPDAQRMAELAATMPGYLSAKGFTAPDGERVTIVEFADAHGMGVWRDNEQHRVVQQRGREKYYSEYSLQVCAELRVAKFANGDHTSSGADPAMLKKIAERWLDCFARRDLDGLLALYADDATHATPKLRDRTLRGKTAMRAWWQDAFDRLPSLRYEPTSLTADQRRVFMEYVRHVDGEAPYPVAEVLEIAGGKITASRVFHG